MCTEQLMNGSNFAAWYDAVFLEILMYTGTERLGFQCAIPGPGVVNIPECFNPYLLEYNASRVSV